MVARVSPEEFFAFLFVIFFDGRARATDGRPYRNGVHFSYLNWFSGVMGCARASGGPWLDATRICRGDHWSPAFRRRNFCFSVYCPFARERRATNGRPYGSRASGSKRAKRGATGDGSRAFGGKQVEGGATGAGDRWSPLRGAAFFFLVCICSAGFSTVQGFGDLFWLGMNTVGATTGRPRFARGIFISCLLPFCEGETGDRWSPLREQSVRERTGEAGSNRGRAQGVRGANRWRRSNGGGRRAFMGRRAGGKKAGRSSK